MMKKFLQLSAGQQNNIKQQLSGKNMALPAVIPRYDSKNLMNLSSSLRFVVRLILISSREISKISLTSVEGLESMARLFSN